MFFSLDINLYMDLYLNRAYVLALLKAYLVIHEIVLLKESL